LAVSSNATVHISPQSQSAVVARKSLPTGNNALTPDGCATVRQHRRLSQESPLAILDNGQRAVNPQDLRQACPSSERKSDGELA
jgi:hypothetical protein